MENKIPKIIHYCWFGGNQLPEDALKCIESWKRYCPDYEIIEWNESNFDINCNMYVKEAYESKKWAFITDFVRLKALVENGGIYMDTDVEVLKPLDEFLKHHAFSGFESNRNIPTGIMGCEKDFELFKIFLDDYKDRHFILKDGSFDLTTNVVTITNICKKYGFKENGKKQEVEGFVLYPSDYFCPKNYYTEEINITENTYTIHHFSGSWLSEENKKQIVTKRNLCKKYGNKFGAILFKILYFLKKPFVLCKQYGFLKGIKMYIKKLYNFIKNVLFFKN